MLLFESLSIDLFLFYAERPLNYSVLALLYLFHLHLFVNQVFFYHPIEEYFCLPFHAHLLGLIFYGICFYHHLAIGIRGVDKGE